MKKGIDVGARYADIRRITLKYFAVAGVHPDDLVQEVAATLVLRNGQASAYDPARGAFSTYVYRVAWMCAARMANKEQRFRQQRLEPELALAA